MSLNTPKGAKSFTKSDTNGTTQYNWLMVTTTAGDVVLQNGSGSWTLSAVPVGVWIPCEPFLTVKDASTAAGFLVA